MEIGLFNSGTCAFDSQRPSTTYGQSQHP
ncbi:unnamed protein product [Acanthoscelides obtectus]|uniref:Uncharacterized protein n=1 Tax=Acanthoscelides obtectus TaxID=200917 RepID=A0A9P0LX92_ACAOB|nr:unnamed protein product [Acanthoscelides obtectus]CAK1675336.1 hypothetical protein AOBTE_LOCUS30144 [Acanthoscelides obtectus]